MSKRKLNFHSNQNKSNKPTHEKYPIPYMFILLFKDRIMSTYFNTDYWDRIEKYVRALPRIKIKKNFLCEAYVDLLNSAPGMSIAFFGDVDDAPDGFFTNNGCTTKICKTDNILSCVPDNLPLNVGITPYIWEGVKKNGIVRINSSYLRDSGFNSDLSIQITNTYFTICCMFCDGEIECVPKITDEIHSTLRLCSKCTPMVNNVSKFHDITIKFI